MQRTTASILILVALSFGCEDEATGPGTDGGTELSCIEALECAEACTTDACVEQCVDRTSPSASTKLEALVSCSETAGCGDDDACIASNCATELGVCVSGSNGDGGIEPPIDDLPNRFIGTTRDHTPNFGSLDLDSNAEVVFVRDDAAAPDWHPIDTHAFYRIESIRYRATAYGSIAGCTYSADATETEASAMPEAWENHLSIEKVVSAGGLHRYDFSTAMTVEHPHGMTIACPAPVGTTTTDFNAEHNFSTGTSAPLTDGVTLVGTTNLSGREWSWNLQAAD